MRVASITLAIKIHKQALVRSYRLIELKAAVDEFLLKCPRSTPVHNQVELPRPGLPIG
jgi:hypothetical protein